MEPSFLFIFVNLGDTPAPGRYNPKNDKYARSCTPTSERGDLNKSPISSVASEKNSVISTPCFRTVCKYDILFKQEFDKKRS